MRRELASLHRADSANFDAMTDALDAIVENTEAASNTILESVEEIDVIVSQIRGAGDGALNLVCGRITDRVNQVFKACSFQDLTGQRIPQRSSVAITQADIDRLFS